MGFSTEYHPLDPVVHRELVKRNDMKGIKNSEPVVSPTFCYSSLPLYFHAMIDVLYCV